MYKIENRRLGKEIRSLSKKASDDVGASGFKTPCVVELGLAKLCAIVQKMICCFQPSRTEATQTGVC